jgi:hypothetical protein
VNENFVLTAIKNLQLIDKNVTVEDGPIEFGLVRRKNKPWLATSVDGVVELTIHGGVPICAAIEIKTMASANTLTEAKTIATQLFQLTYCTFGDENFMKGVKSEYRSQCIHHACVMRVNLVLFVVASESNIIYMLLISFSREDIDLYESILDETGSKLDWIYREAPFPQDAFGDGLVQNGYHVDTHSVKLHLALWRSVHFLIRKHSKPLPPCRYIVPSGIAYWNKTKGYVDVMSRLLSHIKIPFKRAGPVLQLVFRFISIMIVNGHLTTNLLKLSVEDFEGDESYNDIRQKMCKEGALTDYVKTLATNFEIPGCMLAESNQDVCEEDTFPSGSGSGAFAKLPMKRKLTPNEISKFKSIVGKKRLLGELFNSGLPKKVRLDTTYRHIMVDAVAQGRCVLCLLQNKTSWPKFKCKTCGVYLCRKPKAGSRLSCEEKWHANQDLKK